jgi:Flp pilus assembly protein TadG
MQAEPMTSKRRQGEDGAVAIVAAISMLLFMGLLAFTIDIAQLRSERARAQGAVDNVALAAAYASCAYKTDAKAIATGKSVAAANGYAGKVTIAKTGSGAWRATIDTEVDSTFSQVLGAGPELETTVTADAQGSCAPTTPLPALFANSPTCRGETFTWSGSNSTVTGGLHSNDRLRFLDPNVVNGRGTYVTRVAGDDLISWNPSSQNPRRTSVQPLPIVFDVDDYQPVSLGGSRAPGPNYYSTTSVINRSWLQSQGLYSGSTGTLATGTYYSSAGIDLGGISGATGQVTMVTTGRIVASNSDLDIRPYEDGLLLFSDSNPSACSSSGISISNSTGLWQGVFYAPWSQVRFGGPSGFRLSGSIIADTLRLLGGGWHLESPSSDTPGGRTVVLLK